MIKPSRIGVVAGVCCLAAGVGAGAGPAVADSPAGERPLYVTNSDTANISTFATDVPTGQPVLSRDLAEAKDGVRQMAFTPDGRMAYAANTDVVGTISVYRVGAHGRLTEAGVVPTGGDTPLGIAVTPDGRSLFVAHVFSDTVAGFTIASDGSLKRLRTTATSVANPRGLALTPDGRFLYVGHGDPGEGRPDSVGALTVFAVNRDGSLTSIGTPIRVGRFCGALSSTPDGHRLYLVCQDTSEIYGYAIGAGGGLTPLPGSPYTPAHFPEGITTSPDGRFVYTASPGTDPDELGAVTGFAVGGDGALTQVPGSPFAAGSFPVGIVVSPSGRFVYSSGGDATGELSAFRIGAGGTLARLSGSPFDTKGVGPAYNSVAVLPNQGPVAGFAADAGGRSVKFDAAASSDPDGRVAQYRWNFGDGTTRTTADARVTHVYARAGTFRATLVVTDNEGCSTALIATGQAYLCNGTAAAATSRDIVVRG
ncbi:beta-propeller fold lactonase family protein [Actinoplanes sp. NPDC051513]|uniref:beta-propeller fold lactonase family protein n=1 Tax=Actinoplanes sp. NPDC051513 TaxID=3363908 RepID=UPI0037A7A7C4